MKFIVGYEYYPDGDGFDPIRVLKRTEKTMWVTNGNDSWRMRIRTDDAGREYASDSSNRAKWYRAALTYRA